MTIIEAKMGQNGIWSKLSACRDSKYKQIMIYNIDCNRIKGSMIKSPLKYVYMAFKLK